MNNLKELTIVELSNTLGGNRAGATVIAAMGCAGNGIKYGGQFFGPWGAVAGGVGGAAVCGYLAYNAF